ncbi:Bug family tripartite tricarboxylate transporter substrate binding protein [Variovorax ginsengisoli]|uniref:Tripartite tricarboxylate transporter substrate binding protein n=1 Tax=Variovorax ginsengisoli TaxID=363844 RepID=A0ABT8S677_9BURK|nr:tripartite tricarboxylate transporter substrate binding protein [Variovorax ginsengisoli]MDN8615153.1 tripartite tricarboxylate transporter substrate binding protein [Variovorax ginsengisoli]MDO1534323.1 tripartite tricarboxylate transporter substrate binding protein [Variovorax ginsengisoli]
MKTSVFTRNAIAGSLMALASLASQAAQSSEYPNRPIRMVLGYTPGGAADQVARDLAPAMEKVLGQTVVIDYKPGAGGAIAGDLLANSPADGYTIGLIDGGPLTIIPHAHKVGYDPMTSFAYVGIVSQSPLVILVNPSVPATNLPELTALMRKAPGSLNYSTSGLGTIHHLSGELLKAATKTDMVHVPYRGSGPAMTDLMGGVVKVSFATIAPAVAVVQSGRARAIAVTSTREVPTLPGVKPVAEQGVPGYDAQGVFLIAAPKNLPAPILAKLNEALNSALSTPSVRDRFVSLGSVVRLSTPQEAQDLVRKDYQKWGALIREQNIVFE